MSQQLHTRHDDPFDIAEAKENALFSEISRALPPNSEAWRPLTAKLSELQRDESAAVDALGRYREDVSTPLRERALAFDETHRAAMAKVESQNGDALAIAKVLESGWHVAMTPKVDPQREAFVREDVAALLDAAGADATRTIVDLVRGPHRDRAAVAMSDFTDARLQRHLRDASTRERFQQGLRAAALEGALAYGTPDEKAHAKALKELMPRVFGFIATHTVPAKHRLHEAARLRP